MTEKKRNKGPKFLGSKKLNILISCFTIIEAVATITQAYFLAWVITLLFQLTPIEQVIAPIGYFFLAFLLRHSFKHLTAYMSENFSKQESIALRENLLAYYFKQPTHFMRIIGTARLVNLSMEGVDKVQRYMEIIIPRMFKVFIIPAAIVIYVFTLDKLSAVILIVTVPLIIFFMILLGIAAQKLADRQYASYSRLANHFLDSLRGLETLTFLGKAKQQGETIEKVNHDYRKANIKTLRVAFLSSFALDFFTSLSIAFVAVNLGFNLIEGEISLFPALTILLLAPEYFSPIKQIGKDYHATLDGQLAYEEITTLLQTNRLTQEDENNMRIPQSQENNFTLEFKDIGLVVDERKLLNNINLRLSQGLIGLIGKSGAGKTTLLQVLAGQQSPTSGQIIINGEKFSHLNEQAWFEQIAYIPQHPYIFPLSLADNIRFYRPDATDEEVIEVIEQIGLQQLVATLPNGIYEKIGEAGRRLSGGQEHRIALGRAILSKKPILLLDEPTAHLDIETEYEIKQLILQLFTEKLVVIATHRLHWLADMKQVIYLDKGEQIDDYELTKERND